MNVRGYGVTGSSVCVCQREEEGGDEGWGVRVIGGNQEEEGGGIGIGDGVKR